MTTFSKSFLCVGLIITTSLSLATANQADLSLKLEILRAIQKGNQYLASQQNEEGFWVEARTPALSALALTSIARDPNRAPETPLPAEIEKGYQWLLSNQKDDGGIYGKGLATYSTSTAIMALLARENKADVPQILKGRAFLVNQQTDWGNRGETDNKYDGGIGYGGTYAHSDLSNTHLAIEAIKQSQQLAKDSEFGKQPELNWEAALKFVSRSQNLKKTNDQEWASDDEENKGGFVYFPGNSKAGEQDLPNGQKALRSYGSMSYAGLLSLIYADLGEDDPRVNSVVTWLGKNFSLEENPGMGQQGLYYYYQAMAKALTAAGIENLPRPDGSQLNWRHALGTKLLSSQREDGSWVNENSRWWENDPVLVTSYVVMSLEHLYESFPEDK